MPQRILGVDGQRWAVSPAGRVTQYEKDEFALRFVRQPAGSAPDRIVRYSPLGSKNRENSLSALSDA